MSEQAKVAAIVDAIKDAPGSATVSEEAGRMILKAQENHVRRQDQIRSVIQGVRDDGVLQIGEGGPAIEPDEEKHAGAIIGLEVALQLFGDFPIKFSDPADDEYED